MNACQLFRARLESALIGELHGAPALWHDHLADCSACRDLFAAEEALDQLLTCLPEPELPVALAERIVRRLQREQREAIKLDASLDAALAADDVPAGLAERILAGLAAERTAATTRGRTLDDLLGQVPAPEVPSGLAARVLGHVAAERVPQPHAAASGRPLPFFRFGLAAAASVLAMFLGYRLWQPSAEPTGGAPVIADNTGQGGASAAPYVADDIDRLVPEQPDPELLASLDLLEEWDLLVADNPEDLDVVLGSLDDVETELLLLDTYVTGSSGAAAGADSANDEEEG